ncbi:MAG: hypothetical protein ACD_75C01403G0001 [uncultured bacterium]|nr:MAG: hypothetical protein ACD_75C01403G0001 [uncultured bacterium]
MPSLEVFTGAKLAVLAKLSAVNSISSLPASSASSFEVSIPTERTTRSKVSSRALPSSLTYLREIFLDSRSSTRVWTRVRINLTPLSFLARW